MSLQKPKENQNFNGKWPKHNRKTNIFVASGEKWTKKHRKTNVSDEVEAFWVTPIVSEHSALANERPLSKSRVQTFQNTRFLKTLLSWTFKNTRFLIGLFMLDVVLGPKLKPLSDLSVLWSQMGLVLAAARPRARASQHRGGELYAQTPDPPP